jgi:hypothetical protein
MILNSGDVEPDALFPIPADLEIEVVRNVIQLYSPMKATPNDELNDNLEA